MLDFGLRAEEDWLHAARNRQLPRDLERVADGGNGRGGAVLGHAARQVAHAVLVDDDRRCAHALRQQAGRGRHRILDVLLTVAAHRAAVGGLGDAAGPHVAGVRPLLGVEHDPRLRRHGLHRVRTVGALA